MKATPIALTSLALLTLAAAAFAKPGHNKYLFAQLDQNADGQVTLAEMQAGAEKRISEADANGDGLASAEELKALRKTRQAQHQSQRLAKKDANGDGVLSRDEVPRMPAEVFAKLDADSSGTLSREELAAGWGARGRRGGLAAKDKNGDGAVTPDEVPHMPQQLFARLDANGDGVLNGAELTRMHPAQGNMMRRADTNHDGALDASEAKAMAEKHFLRMDKNQDGVLTQDEMKRMAHPGKRRGQGHAKGHARKQHNAQ